MTVSRRIAVAAASLAVAVGGASPALAGASTTMSHWSKAACKAYAKKWEHVSKSKAKTYNKVLKEHGCTQKVS